MRRSSINMGYSLRRVQLYGTNEQLGLPGCITTSPSPVSTMISSRSTKTWLEDNDMATMD
uniref:Uncharacterized protein n=1 Tax=Heterorhabditis bacteriophora TaxID=37862 RepID=A0A1I7XBW7_HETBA